MSYINPSPGVSGAQVTLSLTVTGDTGSLSLPALQNVTINNSNDVFTWTQLDAGSKKQVATTATNSLAMNLVLDQTTFFGTGSGANVAISKGVFGLSKDKNAVSFSLYMGNTSVGGSGKTITGSGYVTGLAPTVSADSPVWVSPITITVDGDYSVS